MERLTSKKIDRRGFLKLAGLAAPAIVLPKKTSWFSLDKIFSFPDSPAKPRTVEYVTQEFMEAAKYMGGVDTLGYRTSIVWAGKDGTAFLAYQRAILKRNPNGEIGLRNILDEMSELGLDDELAQGKYGIIVPPHKKMSGADYLQLPTDVLQESLELKNRQADPGQPTSLPVDYGLFQVVRFQAMAFQQWADGRQEKVLVGDAARRIPDLIPLEARLALPQLDNQPDPLDYTLTATSWEGIASYYSEANCLDCGIDQIMSNGEKFRNGRLTLAFMRAELNSVVLVENRITGDTKIATITDHGGFEAKGWIADLSIGLRDGIGGYDLTPVRITLLRRG